MLAEMNWCLRLCLHNAGKTNMQTMNKLNGCCSPQCLFCLNILSVWRNIKYCVCYSLKLLKSCILSTTFVCLCATTNIIAQTGGFRTSADVVFIAETDH